MNVTTRIGATVKDGAQHLASLRDGRAVFLEGQQVADVTTHPAFRNACAAAAAMYDYQARPENLDRMTFADPQGHRVNRAWQLPTSYAELVQRREALVAWAELSGGFLGRSPDHVASALGGQVPLLWVSIPAAAAQVKAGKLRPLAVSTLKRSATFPDVPTMQEAGVADFDVDSWYAMLVPAKTQESSSPKPVKP
jgi:hypothetical protein